MRLAMEEAQLAFEAGEVPVGAVLVCNGELVSRAHNHVERDRDATRHAEMICLSEGMNKLGGRLTDCTLYVTLEPCAMCAMAAIHARLARVVYAAADPKTGAAGSVFDLIADSRHNHRIEVTGGVLAAEAGTMLTNYFRRKRGKPPV